MAKPAFLFAPGAGAASSHPWMKRWAKLLGTIGRVELMDYPYALAHRGRPDPTILQRPSSSPSSMRSYG
jgi:hypothetical protein